MSKFLTTAPATPLTEEQPIQLHTESREAVAHLSFNQRLGLLEQIARALSENKTPRLSMAANISVGDLLRTFISDNEPAPILSDLLGLPHTVDRCEIAGSAAGRLGIKF